ncbi:uncharacterized protein LOC126668483 [Mercurialis annua]|uniref:uncharacterized protein LOC126668483 n=1 Tax=Mercurialis annua TaxID=3986 RepID=UPI00215F03AC|nr:uncharacterized protein LOC126668483 [Mercurialis annua]
MFGAVFGLSTPLFISGISFGEHVRLSPYSGCLRNSQGHGNFADWCLNWMVHLNPDQQTLAAFICWKLWLNRNEEVWQNKMGTASSLIAEAGFLMASWLAANRRGAELRMAEVLKGDGVVRWCPPEQGWLKANVDAAVYGGKQEIGVGVVVRDWLGCVVMVLQVKILGSFSPRITELMGIREALS